MSWAAQWAPPKAAVSSRDFLRCSRRGIQSVADGCQVLLRLHPLTPDVGFQSPSPSIPAAGRRDERLGDEKRGKDLRRLLVWRGNHENNDVRHSPPPHMSPSFPAAGRYYQ